MEPPLSFQRYMLISQTLPYFPEQGKPFITNKTKQSKSLLNLHLYRINLTDQINGLKLLFHFQQRDKKR